MTDLQERPLIPDGAPRPDERAADGQAVPTADAAALPPAETVEVTAGGVDGAADDEARRWHAEAGRKGARRVHQLIEEGRLYEQEHGLKSGRQRLRQLLELGKLYEQEHGVRPSPPRKRARRLSRVGREELLGTLLQCLVRIARPSFRAELTRLVGELRAEKNGAAHAVPARSSED